MHIVRLNALRNFDQLCQTVAGSAAVNAVGASHVWQPSVDIREGNDGYHIVMDVPAVDPQRIDIAVKERVLTVSGERVVAAAEADIKVHRAERRPGKFARTFTLPEDADAQGIDATAKDGVLTIRIGKRAEAQPVSIAVKVA